MKSDLGGQSDPVEEELSHHLFQFFSDSGSIERRRAATLELGERILLRQVDHQFCRELFCAAADQVG